MVDNVDQTLEYLATWIVRVEYQSLRRKDPGKSKGDFKYIGQT